MMTDSPHSAHRRKMRFRQCAPELSLLVGILAMALYTHISHGQTSAAVTPTPVSAPAPAPPAPTGTPITLEEAIQRAQVSDVNYRTAAATKSIAGLDKSIGRSALLPGVVYHNAYIYTQPGKQSSENSAIT